MLDEGGKEYTKCVLGQGLAKTNPPAETVRDEALLLDQLPGPAVRLLKEPLGEESCRIFPVVGVLRKQKAWEKRRWAKYKSEKPAYRRPG